MKYLKNYWPYFLAPTLTLVIFCLLFQMWKVDLGMPIFSYNNDGLFSIFTIKSVIDTGWYLSNQSIGLPHLSEVFKFYDFPMESDLIHILIVKFFALFSSNPFFVANCFYLTTFPLIALTSFIALRNFRISIFVASCIAILYAFLPFHQVRATAHLFLSNYMVIPLSVMVAVWIASDKITIFAINKKNQYCLAANQFFVIAIVIAAFAAGNNVYYAFYSCVIFFFAWLMRAFKKSSFFDMKGWSAIFICLTTFVVLVILFLPTFFYQIEHGRNSSVAGRSTQDSEIFGLKIIDLFLPVSNHYINSFAAMRQNFDYIIGSGIERASESLGFLGSVGFMFLLLWLVAKNFTQENSLVQKTIKKFSLSKNDQDLISDLAAINVLSVLFATVGGLVMFIAISFPMLRSHARFSVFIAFISLSLVAIICDKIIEKKLFGKKIYAQILIGLVMIFALFDQVGQVSADSAQNKWIVSRFKSDRDFIELIEKSVPVGSMVFILPAHGFPEQTVDDYRSVIAYAHSKNLRWSYPVVIGRESDLWQKKVIGMEFKDFIAELKKAGFVGIYINREQYIGNFSVTKLLKLEADLAKISKSQKLVSQNKVLEFFEI